MIVISILLGISFLLVVGLSFPVKVRVESSLICYITWLFVKVRIRSIKGDLQTDLKLFNRKTRFFSQKQLPDKEKKTSPQKRKKKSRKITRAMVMKSIGDEVFKRVMAVVFRFLIRVIRSLRVRVLKWNIGLKDYYQQGLLTGLLHAIPQTRDLKIRGNFQELNDFILVIHISIWRLIFAAVLLGITFPYVKVFSWYRRVYRQKS